MLGGSEEFCGVLFEPRFQFFNVRFEFRDPRLIKVNQRLDDRSGFGRQSRKLL